MLSLSLSTESEKSIDLTLSIDRYSLLYIFVIECRNSLLFFEVSNVEFFFTFSSSISNPVQDSPVFAELFDSDSPYVFSGSFEQKIQTLHWV